MPRLPARSRAWCTRTAALLVIAGCAEGEPTVHAAPPPEPAALAVRTPAKDYTAGALANAYAYIPPQCYTKTKDERRQPANPCYVCHTTPQAPNVVDDAHLQLRWRMPAGAAANPWSNLFAPALARAPSIDDATMLAYVRDSNYARGDELVLATALAALPEAWDGEADARWDGYVPDAFYRFDAQGFDLKPDGTRSGWRAFAYAPLPGTFFPTNGSGSDVLMRLPRALRRDAEAERINFAIVEALITRRDVPIAVDERISGVDIDLDGAIGKATRVRFEPRRATRLRYVGAAALPIAVGLFPEGTEFLHSLRYLDVRDGGVRMAPRLKELRYARKARWATPKVAPRGDGPRAFAWRGDQGLDNGQGWLLQGFIEDAQGALRPQTHEETVFCAGCHGQVGASTDSMFAFARKLTAPDGGWFHWSQHDFAGLPEPRRADGQYEYELYLRQNHAGDEFRDNGELFARFFEGTKPRANALARLHDDIATLLVPSAPRAMALNQAYRAVVLEQSYTRGRDTVLAPSPRVYHQAPTDKPTGVERPILAQPRR